MTGKILETIERETGKKAQLDTPLDSIGADSLEFMALILEIENETGLQLPAEKIGGLLTVGDIAEALC